MKIAEMPRHEALPPAKVGHRQIVAGPPAGPTVYLIARHDGKLIDVEPTRHAAIGRIVGLHDANDYDIVPVPVGAVPIGDLALPGGDDT